MKATPQKRKAGESRYDDGKELIKNHSRRYWVSSEKKFEVAVWGEGEDWTVRPQDDDMQVITRLILKNAIALPLGFVA
jgi:hypothetical protein